MPIIIAIALLIFVFKGGIFVVFGWLFRAIMAVFGFFATIFSDISMGRYFKKRDKERKNLLADIDKAYEAKNYKKVISLYREVIKDDDYITFDVMKYCHIASDAVCQIAKTIPEYEEARTWTRIISARDSAYEKEAEELYDEIYFRGYEVLGEQSILLVAAKKYMDLDEFDKAKELFTKAADNGNVDVLIMLTEIAISEITDAETIDEARRLVERLEAIDTSLSAEWRKRFDEHKTVRSVEHFENAARYFEEAENKKGAQYEKITLKGIEEWKKIYNITSKPQAAAVIARRYTMIVTEYMEGFHDDRYTLEKTREHLRNAHEWVKICVEDGTEESAQLYKDVTEWLESLEKTLKE